jgi:hypothetical protein
MKNKVVSEKNFLADRRLCAVTVMLELGRILKLLKTKQYLGSNRSSIAHESSFFDPVSSSRVLADTTQVNL